MKIIDKTHLRIIVNNNIENEKPQVFNVIE